MARIIILFPASTGEISESIRDDEKLENEFEPSVGFDQKVFNGHDNGTDLNWLCGLC